MTWRSVFFKRIRKKSAIFFECFFQYWQRVLEHAEETEIVRMAGVDCAPAPVSAAEELFAIDEIDIAVPGSDCVFIGLADDASPFLVIFAVFVGPYVAF